MRTGIRKHAWIYVIAAVLIAVVSVSLYCQFGSLPQKQSGTPSQATVSSAAGQSGTASQGTVGLVGGPCIWATLSFSNATGFVTTAHPTSGTIEFVLLPNSVGEFTVTYTGIDFNNLTIFAFSVTNPVSVINVLSNGTLGTLGTDSGDPGEHQVGQGLSVTESGVTWVSYYQVVVNYTITSGGSDGLYVLGLPSTCLSTIVDVGTQPYTGPLTWLDGIY